MKAGEMDLILSFKTFKVTPKKKIIFNHHVQLCMLLSNFYPSLLSQNAVLG